MQLREVRIPIHGLGCGGGGIERVEGSVRRLVGVVQAYGNPATESIYLIVDPARVSLPELQAAVARAGYGQGPIVGY